MIQSDGMRNEEWPMMWWEQEVTMIHIMRIQFQLKGYITENAATIYMIVHHPTTQPYYSSPYKYKTFTTPT